MSDKYLRDEGNVGAVINTDNAALQQYKLIKEKNRELNNLKRDVNEIKESIEKISNLLLQKDKVETQ